MSFKMTVSNFFKTIYSVFMNSIMMLNKAIAMLTVKSVVTGMGGYGYRSSGRFCFLCLQICWFSIAD